VFLDSHFLTPSFYHAHFSFSFHAVYRRQIKDHRKTHNRNEEKKVQIMYDDHLDGVRYERDVYYKTKQRALNDRRCEQLLSVTFDGNVILKIVWHACTCERSNLKSMSSFHPSHNYSPKTCPGCLHRDVAVCSRASPIRPGNKTYVGYASIEYSLCDLHCAQYRDLCVWLPGERADRCELIH